MEGLLGSFLYILSFWDKAFPQKRTAHRAQRLAICLMLAMGRKTISRANAVTGRDQVDWSADYRLFSRCEWEVAELFQPILEISAGLVEEQVIAVGYDDTLARKTGKKIKGSSWQRDPLSPPFNINFVWGMRYLQASILLPLYQNKGNPAPARGIPIQLVQLPKFTKPRKNAPKEQLEAYRDLTRRYNASTVFVEQARDLRHRLDQLGLADKILLLSVDGSYCNRTCLSADIPNTFIVGRARKDARLYFKSNQLGRRFYQAESFTPEQIRQDQSRPYQLASFYYGGEWRELKYKEVPEVYWKNGTKKKPLRLIVLAPTPYRRTKKGKLNYRDPAYLLTNNMDLPVELLIQKYLDRWQIEVNFKELKGHMGFAQQQVSSAKSIPKAPAFIAASYGALLLAGILYTKDQRPEAIYGQLPKWRNKSAKRPSCLDLLTLIRKEILQKLVSNNSESEYQKAATKVITRSAA